MTHKNLPGQGSSSALSSLAVWRQRSKNWRKGWIHREKEAGSLNDQMEAYLPTGTSIFAFTWVRNMFLFVQPKDWRFNFTLGSVTLTIISCSTSLVTQVCSMHPTWLGQWLIAPGGGVQDKVSPRLAAGFSLHICTTEGWGTSWGRQNGL